MKYCSDCIKNTSCTSLACQNQEYDEFVQKLKSVNLINKPMKYCMRHCSFCGECQTKVKALIAGPEVYICNGCIELCYDLIKEKENASNS